MHTVYNNTHNTCKNESKHSEMDPVRQNPIQRTVSLFICVCIALCTIVAHNIAQNRPDSFPPYPPDDHHISDDVYLREGGAGVKEQRYFSQESGGEWIKGDTTGWLFLAGVSILRLLHCLSTAGSIRGWAYGPRKKRMALIPRGSLEGMEIDDWELIG